MPSLQQMASSNRASPENLPAMRELQKLETMIEVPQGCDWCQEAIHKASPRYDMNLPCCRLRYVVNEMPVRRRNLFGVWKKRYGQTAIDELEKALFLVEGQ